MTAHNYINKKLFISLALYIIIGIFSIRLDFIKITPPKEPINIDKEVENLKNKYNNNKDEQNNPDAIGDSPSNAELSDNNTNMSNESTDKPPGQPDENLENNHPDALEEDPADSSKDNQEDINTEEFVFLKDVGLTDKFGNIKNSYKADEIICINYTYSISDNWTVNTKVPYSVKIPEEFIVEEEENIPINYFSDETILKGGNIFINKSNKITIFFHEDINKFKYDRFGNFQILAKINPKNLDNSEKIDLKFNLGRDKYKKLSLSLK